MDLPEELSQTDDTTNKILVSSIFIPPSIHVDDLVSGASYAHFTPIPSLITTTSSSTYGTGGGGGDEPTQSQRGTECVLGIDEAGRGPVLGPMVYGAFYLPLELHQSLLTTQYHFDDSKVLTPAVRASLMKTLCTHGTDLHSSSGWAIKSLSARDIGSGMLQKAGAYNLNAQAMDATVEIIRGIIERGVNVREIFVDTIGSPAVYQKKLERIFPTVRIRVEKKADSLFPCVSAASVVAKVTRDVSCEVLFEEYVRSQRGLSHTDGGDAPPSWGSGYPSDARCVSWLKAEMNPVFGWGNECRFSWGTVKDLMEAKASGAAKADWPAGDDDDDDESNMRVSDFFVAGPAEASRPTGEAEQLRNWFGTGVGQEAF